MFCPKCGNELSEGAEFCAACGKQIIKEDAAKSALQNNLTNGVAGKKPILIGVIAIVAILVILLVIRPLINNAFEVSNNNTAEKLISSEGDSDNLLLSNFLNDNFDETAEELVNLNKVDGRIKVSSLKKLNETVEKNPDAAVNVIRGWLYNNEG